MPLFDECLVHIGMPKAGSTSIQHTLTANQANLESRGVLYYLSAPERMNNHQLLLSHFDVAPEARTGPRRLGVEGPVNRAMCRAASQAEIEGLYEKAREGRCDRVVFSSESLTNALVTGENFYDLDALKAFFDGLARKTRLVCYVRDPRGWAASGYQEVTKRGVRVGKETALAEAARGMRKALEPYRRLFGSDAMVVRRFDPDALVHGDVVADFFQAIGFPLAGDSDIRVVHRNYALSAEGNRIGEALYERLGAKRQDRGAMWPARLAQALGSIRGARSGLTTPDLDAVYEAARDDMTWLAETFGIDFRADPHPPPCEAPAWTWTTAGDIGTALYKMAVAADQAESGARHHHEREAHLKGVLGDMVRRLVADGRVAPASLLMPRDGDQPPDPDVLDTLVDGLLETGHEETAEAVMDRAREALGEDPRVLKSLARMRSRQGRIDESVALNRRALDRTDP